MGLGRLRTPEEGPWTDRLHGPPEEDFRGPFDRDRDRILHSRAFRRLQHKTQVLIVTEGDDYRTRITHSLEVAQIARSISRALGLSEPLTEAIALGHDVGHTPFGHVGEETLNRVRSVGWNSNTHSLKVLDELETQYPQYQGLNLTWATREGVARHKTPFDLPTEEFDNYVSPSLECQVVNLADPLAYVTHDLHDALDHRLISESQLNDLGINLWRIASTVARAQFDEYHPLGNWPGFDPDTIKHRIQHRQLINILVKDAIVESLASGDAIDSLERARSQEQPVVSLSSSKEGEVRALLEFMFDEFYKSPLVSRQNFKASKVLKDLFEALSAEPKLLPRYVQQRVTEQNVEDEVSYFLASLSDRGALDLHAELFEPAGRIMSRHVG